MVLTGFITAPQWNGEDLLSVWGPQCGILGLSPVGPMDTVPSVGVHFHCQTPRRLRGMAQGDGMGLVYVPESKVRTIAIKGAESHTIGSSDSVQRVK